MKARHFALLLFLCSCAGMQRDCSSGWASAAGADWIVVQYKADGRAFNCWKLENTSMSNEQASDGIYWKDPSGHLVHISGWYNRVQVFGHAYGEAAATVGVKLSSCVGGAYVDTP